MFSRWIHCNACNVANLNPCLLTCRQSPNWAITGKGRNSVIEMEWGETEGSPSAAGGVALQYNQGCSRIGKYFTNKINGDQPTFHLSLSQQPKAELSCQPHFQWKHAFQSHLFFRQFRWYKVPQPSYSLLALRSLLLSGASSQPFPRSSRFPSTRGICISKIFIYIRI